MPNQIYIVNKDATVSGPMAQSQAESYLANVLVSESTRIANLKQSLNDVTSGKGKSTGAYQFGGRPVLHASSGNMQKSVTVFFYDNAGDHYIFAMGEHTGSSTYSLSDYGQADGDFKSGKTISI